MDCKVLATVDTSGTFLHLLPGLEHEARLWLEATLVVGSTDVFELLVGNRHMKSVAGSLMKYPRAQLHVYPNVLESMEYLLAIPMTKGPLSPFYAAACYVASSAHQASFQVFRFSYPVCWWGKGSIRSPCVQVSQHPEIAERTLTAPRMFMMQTPPTLAPQWMRTVFLNTNDSRDEDNPMDTRGLNPHRIKKPLKYSGKKRSQVKLIKSRKNEEKSKAKADTRCHLGRNRRLARLVGRTQRQLKKRKPKGSPEDLQPEPSSIIGRVCRCLSKAATKSMHAMDKLVTIISELQPPPKQHGKRKKASVPRHNEYVIGPRRTWSGVTTFGLMIAFTLDFTGEASATNSRILGPEAVGLHSFTFRATGLLNHADHQNVPPLRRPSRPYPVEADRQIIPHKICPRLASGIVSVDSFNFKGSTAMTAYEQYQKESKDSWIWRNSALMTEEQQRSFQNSIHSRKSAYAYSVEDLPGYSGAMGKFNLTLDTPKSHSTAQRQYSPAEQLPPKRKPRS